MFFVFCFVLILCFLHKNKENKRKQQKQISTSSHAQPFFSRSLAVARRARSLAVAGRSRLLAVAHRCVPKIDLRMIFSSKKFKNEAKQHIKYFNENPRRFFAGTEPDWGVLSPPIVGRRGRGRRGRRGGRRRRRGRRGRRGGRRGRRGGV